MNQSFENKKGSLLADHGESKHNSAQRDYRQSLIEPKSSLPLRSEHKRQSSHGAGEGNSSLSNTQQLAGLSVISQPVGPNENLGIFGKLVTAPSKPPVLGKSTKQ